MEKKDIRKKIASLVSMMSVDEKISASKKICEMILAMEEFKSADIVFSYMAMENEADPMAISRAAIDLGKKLFLPRLETEGRGMDFYFIDSKKSFSSQIKTGRWNILEPSTECPKLDFELIGGKKIFMVVPGVGFSKSGRRLGHGMGFYDIYVSRLKKVAEEKNAEIFFVGPAFSCQIDDVVDEVSNDHDLSVDRVASPC